MLPDYQDLAHRLQVRAEIRRQIPTRRSVQNNEPDRLADLLEEAAAAISTLTQPVNLPVDKLYEQALRQAGAKYGFETTNLRVAEQLVQLVAQQYLAQPIYFCNHEQPCT
jgi:hypothetical protein